MKNKMVNQFELFTMIYLELDTVWQESDKADENLRNFLSDMNPFFWQDLSSGDPAIFSEFCKIITGSVPLDDCFDAADKYMKSINYYYKPLNYWHIKKKDFIKCAKEYLSEPHKGEDFSIDLLK